MIEIVVIIIICVCILLFFVYYLNFFRKKSIIGFSANTDAYDTPFLLKNLLNKHLCDIIISKSVNSLTDSQVIGGKHLGIRNSKQHWISKSDPDIKPLVMTMANVFNIPFANAEDLQVVRYQPNQYYNEHHDSCCDPNPKCQEFIKRGGQRKLTILIYLNNEFTGGNTYFKNLNLKIKPETGDAIVFYPLAKNTSKCHPQALHAGLPVDSGEKWIANIWFRENALQ